MTTKPKKKSKKLKVVKPSGSVIKITKIADGFKLSPSESALIGGDLAVLTQEQRFNLYLDVCRSLRLNPLTKPFGYISLDGEMKLYATKDCAEQLRKLNGIGVTKITREYDEVTDILTVEVNGLDKWGKVDISSGSLCLKKVFWEKGKKTEIKLEGQELANARMKCETKAKRRLALSMSGLSMPDESEVIDIQGVQILEAEEKQLAASLAKVEVLPETTAFKAPKPVPQSVPVAVKASELPMDQVIRALPQHIKDRLKEAGFDTLSKAYGVYKSVAGDVDALEQYCWQEIRKRRS